MAQPRLVTVDAAAASDPRVELASGLLERPARIAPKFFYDALGSRLFEAITELPEYYPPRVERTILDANAAAIAAALGDVGTLVDLGAGSCRKAARLFPALRPHRYAAVDISADYLRDVLADLQREFPGIEMLGVGMDFSRRLVLPPEIGRGPHLLFYPGSSIGNFTPDEAQAFVRQCRAAADGGALLIGVDLVKPKAALERAYDDPLQVTAAFNRNLLLRLRSLLGCDARLEDFDHVAFFNERESRIEMHLQARHELVLRWPGGERALAAGERIHTENSYKYRIEGFAALLREAGFTRSTCWTDAERWFAVFLAAG